MEDDQISRAGKPAGAPPQSRACPHRILVADDEPCIRTINAKMLSASGYQVDAVEDGAAAWDNLQRNNYDLLITDNSMPKVTGVELIKMLRDARMTFPVIIATGSLPEGAFTTIPSPERPSTLLKPYTLGELLGTVKKVLA